VYLQELEVILDPLFHLHYFKPRSSQLQHEMAQLLHWSSAKEK